MGFGKGSEDVDEEEGAAGGALEGLGREEASRLGEPPVEEEEVPDFVDSSVCRITLDSRIDLRW